MATKEKKVVKNKKDTTKKEELKKEKVVVEENKKNKEKKVSKKEKKNKKDKPKKERFIKSTIREMKQVKFPTKKEMIKLSIATIVFVIFFGVLFFGVDAIMSWLKQVM